MKRRYREIAQTLYRVVKPAILPITSNKKEMVNSVCELGPSPIRWSRLWKEAREKASKEILQTRLNIEKQKVALLNAMTISPSGPQILSCGTAAILGFLNLQKAPFHSSHPAVWPSPPVSSLHSSWIRRCLEEIETWMRMVQLWLLFTPVLLWAPLALRWGLGRSLWVELVRWTLENAGPAFIKWGQWGATRPDLLPLDLCQSLESLHSQAPIHDFVYTRREIEASFGRPLELLFTEFEQQPVASGSVAQVHRAKLTPLAAAQTNLKAGSCVAVKVRHPGVQILMERDFKLMMRACCLSRKLPLVSGLRLDESIRQFGTPLHEQLNFQLEAQNLDRFEKNFSRWSSVGFPKPLYPFISQSVLLESFEDGDLISQLVHNPDYQASIEVSYTGLDLYLKMLISDNFLHADLHPGNILVQDCNLEKQSWMKRILVNLKLTPRQKLVLLDAGMVTELTPQDQQHVMTFFQALTRIDGVDVAQTILDMAINPKCPDPNAFIRDMKDLFDGLDFDRIRKYTSEVIQEMLTTVRHHEVTLKGSVCTLMATTLVLEGWSTKLNPDISIMERLRSSLPSSQPLNSAMSDDFLF